MEKVFRLKFYFTHSITQIGMGEGAKYEDRHHQSRRILSMGYIDQMMVFRSDLS